MTSVHKAFIAAAATAAIGIGSLGASSAFAAEKPEHPGFNHLVEAIATKFNLDKDEVQKVFDEQRSLGEADRKAAMEKHGAALLAQAVTDGKITQAQADLIIAKRAELKGSKPDFAGKTPEEIRAALKVQGDAVKAWAEANGIPEQFLLPRGPMMMHLKGPDAQGGDHFFKMKISE